MEQRKLEDTILAALVKKTNRAPIPFNEEPDFMASIGVINGNEFSDACHHLEALGYVNYTKTNGLQITPMGMYFSTGTILKQESKEEIISKSQSEFSDDKRNSIISNHTKCLTVGINYDLEFLHPKLSLAQKIKVLFGGIITIKINVSGQENKISRAFIKSVSVK